MASDGDNFWRHRKCYGHVFNLVKRGKSASVIAAAALQGFEREIRRFIPQKALKAALSACEAVLKKAEQHFAGGLLLDETPHFRQELRSALATLERQYAAHEATRAICHALRQTGDAWISALQQGTAPSMEQFGKRALVEAFRLQVSRSIVDSLRDHADRYQNISGERFAAYREEVLGAMQESGTQLLEACLRGRSGVASKNWRTGGQKPVDNSLESLNAIIGRLP